VTLDAPDITETLANVAISSGGTRLAPTKSYGTVKSVHLTVVNDGGSAVSATQEDTQATGPLVKIARRHRRRGERTRERTH
jgi:hypothetical protein